MTMKALRFDDSVVRNSIEFVLKDKRLKNAARVINPTDIGAKRQFISKNPRLHQKFISPHIAVGQLLPNEGISIFGQMDRMNKGRKTLTINESNIVHGKENGNENGQKRKRNSDSTNHDTRKATYITMQQVVTNNFINRNKEDQLAKENQLVEKMTGGNLDKLLKKGALTKGIELSFL